MSMGMQATASGGDRLTRAAIRAGSSTWKRHAPGTARRLQARRACRRRCRMRRAYSAARMRRSCAVLSTALNRSRCRCGKRAPEQAKRAPEKSLGTGNRAPEKSLGTGNRAPEKSPGTGRKAPEKSPGTVERARQKSPVTSCLLQGALPLLAMTRDFEAPRDYEEVASRPGDELGEHDLHAEEARNPAADAGYSGPETGGAPHAAAAEVDAGGPAQPLQRLPAEHAAHVAVTPPPSSPAVSTRQPDALDAHPAAERPHALAVEEAAEADAADADEHRQNVERQERAERGGDEASNDGAGRHDGAAHHAADAGGDDDLLSNNDQGGAAAALEDGVGLLDKETPAAIVKDSLSSRLEGVEQGAHAASSEAVAPAAQ